MNDPRTTIIGNYKTIEKDKFDSGDVGALEDYYKAAYTYIERITGERLTLKEMQQVREGVIRIQEDGSISVRMGKK